MITRRTLLAALLLTPRCDDHQHATPSEIEGPFYLPNTPLRTSLREADTVGAPLTLRGRVLSSDGKPLQGAVLDFWSCDGKGVYDVDGYRLRGHQFTNAAGEFHLETVKPSDYIAFGIHRTAHIHVKAQGRKTRLLTTQLYFPGEPYNAKDALFNEALLVRVVRPGNATFDFVLA